MKKLQNFSSISIMSSRLKNTGSWSVIIIIAARAVLDLACPMGVTSHVSTRLLVLRIDSSAPIYTTCYMLLVYLQCQEPAFTKSALL